MVVDVGAEDLQANRLPLMLKGTLVQEEQGPKIVAQEIAPLATAFPRWPERLDLRLNATALSLEQLQALKEILSLHRGPVPTFLHFLDRAAGDDILALPEELTLTPSENLATEVNRLFGYPVLSW